MKYGALGFSYAHFPFADWLERDGHYTVNLGDNTQTIATRHVYRHLGVADDDVILIDRDTLPTYAGPRAFLVMNGYFCPWSFPVSDRIVPVFVGFCAAAETINANRDYLKRFEPIGCRDHATQAHCEAAGIYAVTTGCLTLAFDRRTAAPEETKLLIVYGGQGGVLPPQIIKHIPPELADAAEFVSHRLPAYELPLSEQRQIEFERYEQHLLDRYRAKATHILTPLHHVAAPAVAIGVKTILARYDFTDGRFGLLGQYMPLYTPDRFSDIDWNPAPVDVSQVRDKLLAHTGDRMASALARAA